MAQASRICQNPCVISNLSKSNQRKSPFSVSLKTHQISSWGLKKSNNGSVIRPVRVTASVSTAEKSSEIVLQPIREISGLIKLPGSKSLSNRILLLAALSEGDVKFAEVLEKMGCKVSWTENSVTVTGPSRDAFGMRHLRAVDVNMNKMPDVAMTLAVVALFADGPTTIRDVASWRVKETERMIAICTELRKLGATVEEGSDYCVITPPAKLKLAEIDTYDDHRMAMAFSLAACADVPVTIKDPGCTRKTFPDYFQGDVKFAEVLEKMGCKVSWTENSVTVTGPSRDAFGMRHLRAVDVNMNKMPDVAMTLAVVALFADGLTTIRDVASWRVKETERMIAICTELRKLGATVEEGSDYCVITPPAKLKPAEIDTYDDHRMAMAFSLAACADVPVTIKDPGCTRKTFPDYFQVLESITKH
ncbi:hypothetical protein F2Q68_00001882 [Brassica cretica]|uniref:3-phosphoshikimate 1-carboxyvinyltransferase n=1 Tax=Brassica cretica TaxID=69181 RepID=A0A8S9JEW7_BRACR|nr:hypothetical protein F2Q68_00001882 [Brassica cretica]